MLGSGWGTRRDGSRLEEMTFTHTHTPVLHKIQKVPATRAKALNVPHANGANARQNPQAHTTGKPKQRAKQRIAQKLMDLGQSNSDVKYADKPLHHAARQGNARVVEILLDEIPSEVMCPTGTTYVRSTMIDARTTYGMTAFMIACYEGCVAIVRLLVQRGCTTNLRDHRDKTGFELAQHSERRDIVQCLTQIAAEGHDALNQEIARCDPSIRPASATVAAMSPRAVLKCPNGRSGRHIFLSYRLNTNTI